MDWLTEVGKYLAPLIIAASGLLAAWGVKRRGTEDADDRRDDARWARMDTDLDTLRTTTARLEALLVSEKADREKSETEFWQVLHSFRIRDSVWFGLYHDVASQVVALGGIPKQIPDVLKTLPAYPIESGPMRP